MRDPLGEAVAHIRDGGLIAYPTETVWGIGGDARSEAAIERLRRWKGRSDDAPIAILVADFAELEALGCRADAAARRLAQAFWPGPLMLVVACQTSFARGVGRPDGAVGVRCSSHPLAAALARRCGAEGTGPITSTSLNRSGEPAARTRDEACQLLAGAPDAPRLVDVEAAEAGGAGESTVVDLTEATPRVLRWGAVGAAEIEPLLGQGAAG
jgi:L-threonylcarbamoyladenylate synthase